MVNPYSYSTISYSHLLMINTYICIQANIHRDIEYKQFYYKNWYIFPSIPQHTKTHTQTTTTTIGLIDCMLHK